MPFASALRVARGIRRIARRKKFCPRFAQLDKTFEEAEALLLKRLGEVTLAALAKGFKKRIAARGAPHELERAHAS
jgi:hypothetical protein|tara:strand:- start:3081 stop:3308 length:228 start_codon:yes stop_codon:yes gene_type:complete